MLAVEQLAYRRPCSSPWRPRPRQPRRFALRSTEMRFCVQFPGTGSPYWLLKKATKKLEPKMFSFWPKFHGLKLRLRRHNSQFEFFNIAATHNAVVIAW